MRPRRVRPLQRVLPGMALVLRDGRQVARPVHRLPDLRPLAQSRRLPNPTERRRIMVPTTLETLEALEQETPGAIDWAYAQTTAETLVAAGFRLDRGADPRETMTCARCGKPARTGPARWRSVGAGSELTHVGGCP